MWKKQFPSIRVISLRGLSCNRQCLALSSKDMRINKIDAAGRLFLQLSLASQLPYLSGRLVCRFATFMPADDVPRDLEGIGARRENLV